MEAEVGGGQEGGDFVGSVIEGGVVVVHGLLTVYAGREVYGERSYFGNPTFLIDNAVGLC